MHHARNTAILHIKVNSPCVYESVVLLVQRFDLILVCKFRQWSIVRWRHCFGPVVVTLRSILNSLTSDIHVLRDLGQFFDVSRLDVAPERNEAGRTFLRCIYRMVKKTEHHKTSKLIRWTGLSKYIVYAPDQIISDQIRSCQIISDQISSDYFK